MFPSASQIFTKKLPLKLKSIVQPVVNSLNPQETKKHNHAQQSIPKVDAFKNKFEVSPLFNIKSSILSPAVLKMMRNAVKKGSTTMTVPFNVENANLHKRKNAQQDSIDDNVEYEYETETVSSKRRKQPDEESVYSYSSEYQPSQFLSSYPVATVAAAATSTSSSSSSATTSNTSYQSEHLTNAAAYALAENLVNWSEQYQADDHVTIKSEPLDSTYTIKSEPFELSSSYTYAVEQQQQYDNQMMEENEEYIDEEQYTEDEVDTQSYHTDIDIDSVHNGNSPNSLLMSPDHDYESVQIISSNQSDDVSDNHSLASDDYHMMNRLSLNPFTPIASHQQQPQSQFNFTYVPEGLPSVHALSTQYSYTSSNALPIDIPTQASSYLTHDDYTSVDTTSSSSQSYSFGDYNANFNSFVDNTLQTHPDYTHTQTSSLLSSSTNNLFINTNIQDVHDAFSSFTTPTSTNYMSSVSAANDDNNIFAFLNDDANE